MTAATLFENAMERLRNTYVHGRFLLERDIVQAVRSHLLQEVRQCGLPYRVLTEHRVLGRKRADLVIISGGTVAVAAEFKYEPSPDRSKRISDGKFPVVAWKEVLEDVERVQSFVEKGNVRTAYAVLIDEGGCFRPREVSSPSQWCDWSNGVCVLWTKVTGP